MDKVLELKTKTMFPKKRLDMDYMFSYLVKSSKKYVGRTPDGVRGVVRSLQDGIGFAKHGGKVPVSTGVQELFEKQGYVLRKQVTAEHKTPLATYKHDIHKYFFSNPAKFWDLLWEKTDTTLVTKEEDKRLRAAKLTSSLPKDGSDRYEVAGIEISDLKLSLEDIKYPK